MMDWTAWVPTAILGFALYLGRNWIKARIEKSVQHEFDTKIELLRTELRNNEENFKSDLRTKEVEISALRDGVLSGRANRQALLDKRRIQAVEKVWTAVTELERYKFVSATMAVIKFDAAAREASKNPKFRKMFEVIGNALPDDSLPENLANKERPFVSPVVWALFSAYLAVIGLAYFKAKVLELGIEDPGKLFDTESAANLLKTALPDKAGFVDEYGSGAYHYLLNELEEKLLAELRKMLEGEDIDEASVAQSVKIMKEV